MPVCIFQHLSIWGKDRLSELAWEDHVGVKDRAWLLPNPQMGWACFSPCICFFFFCRLALKPQESGSGISSKVRKASVEEEFGCFWTLRSVHRLQMSCTLSITQCHTLRHNPPLDCSPRRPQDQPVSVPTLACVGGRWS